MKPDYLVKTRRQAIARARRKFGLKDYEGALAEWDELMDRNQDDPLPWLGRFDCLMKLERKQEMLEIGDKVCELFPESEAAHNNYACLLLEQGEYDKACRHFDVALAIAPERTMYYFNAGLAYRGAGKLNEAAVCFEQVLDSEPGHERALEFLSQIYLQFGLTEQVTALSMRLRLLRPGYTLPLQRRLHVMFNDPSVSEQELSMEISLLRTALLPDTAKHPAPADAPLRIGWIVCPYSLPFLRYVMPTLHRVRNSAAFQLVAYCNQPLLDLSTVESYVDAVHRIDSGTLDALTKSLEKNPVDVLIDTAGQVPNNLLQHYARRLAPRQVSWPFFHTRIEMVLMDYAMVAQSLIPDNLSEAGSRSGVNTVSLADRLVDCGESPFFYDPSDVEGDVAGASPRSRNGFVTFGVVADPVSISQACVNLWAGILNAVPEARLAFHQPQLPAAIMERQMLERCAAAGIKADRVDFVARSSNYAERLAAFEAFDILLSPWPVTDDLALVDALVSGCPVVTLARDVRGRSRAGSILPAAGQSRFLHEDEAEYREAAVRLASDPAELQELRMTLRDAVLSSQICQADRLGALWLERIADLTKC